MLSTANLIILASLAVLDTIIQTDWENELACPFFSPTQPAHDIALPYPARLPLGAAWRGSCQSPGHELHALTNQDLEACNLGHAHFCPRLPKERSCDSIRFAVSSNTDGRVALRFVLDAAHHPVGYGLLEYDRVAGAWLSPHPEPRIQRLADCFLRSYLKRHETA